MGETCCASGRPGFPTRGFHLLASTCRKTARSVTRPFRWQRAGSHPVVFPRAVLRGERARANVKIARPLCIPATSCIFNMDEHIPPWIRLGLLLIVFLHFLLLLAGSLSFARGCPMRRAGS